MSSLEMISIISKPWANVNDIKKLAFCGRDKATIIRDDIIKNILNDGLSLPSSKSKIVPMPYVIEYLNLNVDYIYSMAKKEKNLL